MSNLSYCRFRNTLRDLRDCHDNANEEKSEEEAEAFRDLVLLCKDIVDEYGPDFLQEEDEDEDE